MVLKSEGLSSESIEPPITTVNSLVPKLDYFNNPKFRVEFNGSFLKPINASFTPTPYVDNGFRF